MQGKYQIFFSVFGILACSSPKPFEGQEPFDPYATADGFCQEWARAACNDDVVSICGMTDDNEGCLESQEAFCDNSLEDENYVPDNARDCVDAVRSAYADGDLSAEELQTVRRFGPPCDTLWKGDSDEGEKCDEPSDCDTVDGYTCVRKGETSTCQIPEVVGGGRSCDEAQQICEEDFYCDGENCLERLDLDESCQSDEQCKADLRCEGGGCVERAGPAEHCTSDAECASNLCTIAFGDSSGICVSMVRLSASEPVCKDLRSP